MGIRYTPYKGFGIVLLNGDLEEGLERKLGDAWEKQFRKNVREALGYIHSLKMLDFPENCKAICFTSEYDSNAPWDNGVFFRTNSNPGKEEEIQNLCKWLNDVFDMGVDPSYLGFDSVIDAH